MLTRSKTKNASLLFLAIVAVIVSGCNASDAAINTKCPTSISIVKKIIYADQCMEKGIAVASITGENNDKQRLCWFPIQCPSGHINIPIPLPPNTGYCGSRCSCPKWTRTCSFYNGRHKETSHSNNVLPSLFNYKPPQIELYDGTKIIVPELHITKKDFFNKDDYYCFSYDGRLISNPIPVGTEKSGSPAFCRHHKCAAPTIKSVFCVYYSPVTTFDLMNSSIIVRAWGTIPKEYFSHKDDVQSSESSYLFPICKKGGITVKTTTMLDILEAYSSTTCIYIKSYETDTLVLFPTSIVIFEYEVFINGWINGEKILSSTLTCPGQPICETLQCYICWKKVYNIQCWTTLEMAASLIIFVASMLLLHFCTPIFRLLYWIGRKLIHTLHSTIRRIFFKYKRITGRTQSYQVERPSYQLKKRKKKIHGIIATIACLITTAQCCSNIVTLQGETSHCTMENNEERCTYNQVTQLLLQPIGQEACLVLKNKENRIMGTVAIRLEQISHICRQKTEYFTRDHKFFTESRHQCYNTESCKGNTCSSLKPEMKLNDFSTISNSNPGYTYCVPSCGCFWCNWCFYCTSTCLFYRNYAMPTSPKIYRIFSCPTWSIQAEGIATI
ncbi:hypothetical protein TELCIR_15886, partial [Teladorsagia circumcincta]